MVNSLWSTGVGKGVTLTTGLLVAGILGNDKDKQAVMERAARYDRDVFRIASDALSLIDPVATPRILDMIQFHNAGLFETPAGSSVDELVLGTIDIVKSAAAFVSGDPERGRKKGAKGLRRIALESTALLGLNPLDAQLRRILREYDKLSDDEKQKIDDNLGVVNPFSR